MDERNIRAIEEEAGLLAEFIRTQGQVLEEMRDLAKPARARAKAAVDASRRVRAEIAARRAAARPAHRPHPPAPE
jgi:hypothetical protein